jgi:RHS repeat-associated protein
MLTSLPYVDRRQLISVLAAAMLVFAMPAHAQYTTSTGMPTFTTAIPVEMGFTNVANGNLHLEIPLASFPQRGSLTYNARLVYDSLIWKIDSNAWKPTNVPNSMGGWRLITGGETGNVTFVTGSSPCDTPPPIKTRTFHSGFVWTAPDGTSHTFPIFTQQDRTICAEDIKTDTELADDSSGFTMSVTNYTSATVFGPDGTQVYPTVMDTNGNFFSKDGTGQIIDTLGRTPITVTPGTNTITYGVLNAQGTRTNIIVTTTTVSANTSFGASGIAECQTNCSVTAIQSIAFGDSTSYTFTYDSGTTSGHFGVLTGMTLRTGQAINFGYGTFADFAGNHSRWLTSKGDGTNNWAYTPQALQTITNQVTVTEPSHDGIRYIFSLNNGAWMSSAGYFDSAGNSLLFLTNTWDTSNSCPISGCTGAAYIRRMTSTTQFPNGLKKTITYSYTSPISGQLSEIDESDYSTNTPPVLRKTLFTYAALTNTVSKLHQITVLNASTSQVVSQTTYGYDESTPTPTSGVPQHGSSVSSRGNLTSVGRWLNTTNSNLNTISTYDDTGNVLTVEDPGFHTTQFSYLDNFADGIGRGTLAYRTQITRPDTNSPNLAHHISRAQYDFNTGLPTGVVDENSKQTTLTYDSLMRPLQTSFPDGGQTNFSYPSVTQAVVQAKIDGTRSTYSTTLLDHLGRTTRTAKANGEVLQYDLQDFCYDGNGRLSFQSYPYQSGSYTGASVCSGAGDSFAYDGLGRTTTVTHSDGSHSSVTYTARARQITDEGNGSYNVSRILQSDGLGRLTSVCEVSSASLLGNGGTPATCGLDIAATGFLTSYGYDLNSNLTSVTQGSLVGRMFTYDSLSRMTSESETEWGAGSTMYYSYNADSVLIQRTRPAPNQANPSVTVTTTYVPDELHRLRTKTYSDGATPLVTLNYDESTPLGFTASNTIGLRSSEIVGNAKSAFSYDEVGRVVNNWQCTPQTTCVPANYYHLTYGYDFSGDPTSATSGVGVTFNYSYNIGPRIIGVTSSLADSTHPGTLLSSVHYNQFGPVSDTLGNGLAETFGYSAYGAVQSYSSTPYTFSLGFAPNWNVTSANDSLNGNWTYSYDEFNRLAGSNKNSGAQTFGYVYDRYGNRLQQNAPQGGPAPQYVFDNTNRITGSGVTYDALGNVTNDGFHSYSYDAESRLITVDGGTTATYVYDAEGRRVHTPGYESVYDLAGRAVTLIDLSGVWAYGEIYVGGRHLATYSGATTNFLHSDWLGTKRMMSSISGASSETCTGFPFADGVSCTGTNWTFNGFADDIHDTESNLEHTMFRQLSGTQGRWTSPDPYLGSMNLANPQSLNRFSYVMNNPLNAVDPSGLSGDNPCDDPDIDCRWDPEFAPIDPPDELPIPNVVFNMIIFVNRPNLPTFDFGFDENAFPLLASLFNQDNLGFAKSAAPSSKACSSALTAANRSAGGVARANAAWGVLQAAANAHDIPTPLLAAIGVRESDFMNVQERLKGGGLGPGMGVFQLTNQPGVSAAQAFNLPFAANYAANMLSSNMNYLSNTFSFTPSQLMQATAASYNFGTGNISGNPNTIDVGTTGNNYGRTVVDLMVCF